MEQNPAPPIPPDVRRQQQEDPALAQYAEGALKRKKQQAMQNQPAASLQLVGENLKKIATNLTEIAQVLSVEKPALMPLVTRMAGVGKQLENQLQQVASQGPGSPQAPGVEPAQSEMEVPEGPASISA